MGLKCCQVSHQGDGGAQGIHLPGGAGWGGGGAGVGPGEVEGDGEWGRDWVKLAVTARCRGLGPGVHLQGGAGQGPDGSRLGERAGRG